MNELSAKFFDIDTQELDVSDKNVKSFTVDQVKF